MDSDSIWKRLKVSWILAVIVIQFVDLSVNRKYQFPSFDFFSSFFSRKLIAILMGYIV
jgi:hypothetical protein